MNEVKDGNLMIENTKDRKRVYIATYGWKIDSYDTVDIKGERD